MTRYLLIFLGVLLLSFAGGGQVLSADAPVTISVRAEVEDDVLHIHGSASVPDGAWIIYAAYRVAEPQQRRAGYVRTKNERFAAEADVSGWPAGEIAVDAHFQLRLPVHKQPDAVVTRFGRDGERMRGKSVVQGGNNFRAAIASTKVVKRR